jgi:hypothetical protein
MTDTWLAGARQKAARNGKTAGSEDWVGGEGRKARNAFWATLEGYRGCGSDAAGTIPPHSRNVVSTFLLVWAQPQVSLLLSCESP